MKKNLGPIQFRHKLIQNQNSQITKKTQGQKVGFASASQLSSHYHHLEHRRLDSETRALER